MDKMKEIYSEHARTVYKFLLAQSHDAALAEELTQETFYQAIKSIGRFEGKCKMSVWLCQIAKHLWCSHLKKRKRAALLLDDSMDIPLPSAEESVISRQSHVELMERIHALPAPMQEVMYLRIAGELTFKEIGNIMGRTENWARVTFYRGKEKLITGVDDL